MKKPYLKQRSARKSNCWESVNKAGSLSDFAEKALLSRKVIMEVGLVLLALFTLSLFTKQVLQPEIIVDPIRVPEDIARRGYTEIIVAEQLVDAALNIRFDARKLSSNENEWNRMASYPGLASAMKVGLQDISMNAHLPDILVPGAQFSIRTISRFIRKELGLPSIHIRGEIVHSNEGLVLTLRKLSTEKVPPVRILQKDKEVEQIFRQGGDALLKLTAPSALALYSTQKWSRSAHQREGYEQLVQLFEYCLDYSPTTDNTTIHYLWGAALIVSERYDESVQQFDKAIDLDPKFSPAYSGRGIAFVGLRRYDEAINEYQTALTLYPNDVETLNYLGGALNFLNRYEEAIKQFDRAIALEPKYVNAYYYKGFSLKQLGRYDEAIKQFEMAVSLDPKRVNVYYMWSSVLVELKRFEEAREKYRRAYELELSNPVRTEQPK